VTVVLRVKLCCFARMVRSVLMMSVSAMGVVGRPFVISCLVMLGCFAVMLGRGVMVLGCLVVMLDCLLGHISSFAWEALRCGLHRSSLSLQVCDKPMKPSHRLWKIGLA
jgi:hypothetical protein